MQALDPIEQYGGAGHICDLYEIAHYCIDWENHLSIQKNRYAKRKLTEYLKSQLNKIAVYSSQKINDIMQEIHLKTEDMIKLCNSRKLVKASDLKINFQQIEKNRINTGWYDLDKLIGGIGRGNLVVIGARSSMGKTAFACNMTLQIIAANKKVLFLTLEMTNEQIFLRMMSCNSRSKNIFENEHQFENELKKISVLPLIMDEESSTINEILLTITEAYYQENIDVVIIDYLQLIYLQDTQRKENRNIDIGYITAKLKRIAIKYNVAIVCLAQLNRLVEGRNDKRPMLSDLRDSGNIEQDADVVMLLYRDDYYHPDKNPGIAECIVAKNRHGNTGTVKFKFQKDCGRFQENTFPL